MTTPTDKGGFDIGRFERWMLTVVRHPDGVSGGLPAAHGILGVTEGTLDEVVLPAAGRSGHERLSVYANMYFGRLVDILRDEFEAVHHAVTHEVFWDLGVAYLTEHPSRHYRLAPLGAHFADWLRDTPLPVEHRGFLVDLARLERAKEVVFNEKRSALLSPAEIAAVPPEQWGDARLQTIPALRILQLDYLANAYFADVMKKADPSVPGPEATWLVVWRDAELIVWRADLTRDQYVTLGALAEGLSLADAIERCVDAGADPDAILPLLGGWFQAWTADGLFAGISVG